jgi:uncharacterized protein (DUF697 family)
LASKLSMDTVYEAVRGAHADATRQIGLVIAGDAEAAAALAAWLAGDGAASEAPRVLAPGAVDGIRRGDVVLLVTGDDDWLRAVVAAARRVRAGLVVLLPTADAVAAHARARDAGVYEDEMVVAEPLSAASLATVAGALARAARERGPAPAHRFAPLRAQVMQSLLPRTAGERGPALARRFPPLRDAVVQRLVRRAAAQNGAVGVVVFVPGADMPIMTLNQVRMVMRIGTAYGRDLSPERVPEVLSIVAAGLGLRSVARQVLGMVPLAGWAVKGSIGYAGTLALGEAAIKYYESGIAPVDPARVKGLLNKVVKRGKAATG